MRADTARLLCAALLAQSIFVAARPGGASHRTQQLYPASNSSLFAPSLTPSPENFHSSAVPEAIAPTRSSLLTAAALAIGPSDLKTHRSSSSGPPTEPSPAPPTPNLPDFNPNLRELSTQPLPTGSRLSPPSSSPSLEATSSVSSNCLAGTDSFGCTNSLTTNEVANLPDHVPTSTDCTSIPEDRPITHFSVVYTSTVTFFGNRSDYTPPYKPLVTPHFCTPTFAPAFAPAHISGAEPWDHATAAHVGPAAAPAAWKDTDRRLPRPSVTFITTDKNPSVAFPSDQPPRFAPTSGRVAKDHGNADHKPAAGNSGSGGEASGAHGTSPSDGDHGSGVHKPAAGAGDGVGVDVKSVAQGFPTPDAARARGGPASFKVTARGNQVTINDETFIDLGPGETSTVTANGALFTISPSAIVGVGATIQKPVPAGTVVSVATPTSDVVGGLPVTLKGSEAVVGHATLTMTDEGTATVVDGHEVSLDPGTLAVGKQTLSFQPVMPRREMEMLVKGGELLTAVGRSIVVIHSTTFTYGPEVAETTQVVDDDTITIGPSGVFVHGVHIGGPSVDATETDFEVVGGATITRIAPSLAVINGATFTIGPGTHWTTTVVAGETLTIGPTGVVMSTTTYKYPFGLAVTSTVRPSGTHLNDLPLETADRDGQVDEGIDDEDSMGSLLSPDPRVWCVALSIAIGVLLGM